MTPYAAALNEIAFYAILAIRALEDARLHVARDIAHVIHHVPITLRAVVGPAEYAEAIAYILSRAESRGIGEVAAGWIANAERRTLRASGDLS